MGGDVYGPTAPAAVRSSLRFAPARVHCLFFGVKIPLALFGGYHDVCVVLLSRKVINPLPLLFIFPLMLPPVGGCARGCALLSEGRRAPCLHCHSGIKRRQADGSMGSLYR